MFSFSSRSLLVYSCLSAVGGCLQSHLQAVTNLATGGTATASSQYSASYPPQNAIDGVVSDPSRWLSADTTASKWLAVEMTAAHELGGFILYSGYQTTDAVSRVFLEQRVNGAWVLIPSSLVTGNTSQELVLKFDQQVNTDAIRFNFEQSGIVRVREVVLFAPGDAPIDPPPPPGVDPFIFVNQSGYNLGESKRFTALGFTDGAEFTIRTKSGETVFTGTLINSVGDFTAFNPENELEYIVRVGSLDSDPFRIGPWWLERVTYQNAIDFMIQSRNYVGNVSTPATNSYSWRDDVHFAFSLRSLVDQYLSNPEAYQRMPHRITYTTPRNNAWGALTPYNESVPDIIKMMHWGADVIVTQNLTHEMMKNELAYFLYAWPWIHQGLPDQNYQIVRDFVLAHWADSTVPVAYAYDETPADGHNLFNIKTKTGSTKGGYPPGFSILPNALMAVVMERENDPRATQFRDAARAQVSWIVQNLNVDNTQVTKGQRMSENLLLMGMAEFARVDPAGVPEGFNDFIVRWSDVAIRRSSNFWDFRKLADDDRWTPFVPSQPTQWNEPGNVVGFPAAALEASGLVVDTQRKARLEQLAWAAFDNMFGRNPTGRHFSYDAPREIEGVERGWYSYYNGGIGQLKDVPFVLDGAPKDPHYPYHPEVGNIGWTEGWVNFNTAYNRSLAVLAYHRTWVKLSQQGSTITLRLQAPLNFNYQVAEPIALKVTASGGDSETVLLSEDSPFSLQLAGNISVHSTTVVPGNGILEAAPGETLQTNYGLGFYQHSDTLTVVALSTQDSDSDGLPDDWERLYYPDTITSNAAADADHDGLSDLMEYALDLDPLKFDYEPLAMQIMPADTLVIQWRENTAFSGATIAKLYQSIDLVNWQPVIYNSVDAIFSVANEDVDADGSARLVEVRIPMTYTELFFRLQVRI